MADFETGDLIRTTAAFTDTASGAALDPDNVFFTVTDPGGTPVVKQFGVDAEVVKDSVGNYHADIDANAAGAWRYRWHSTGNGQASKSRGVTVRKPKTQ